MNCTRLHFASPLLDTCLLRQSRPEFEYCHACAQGLSILEAVQFMDGEPIKVIQLRPKAKPIYREQGRPRSGKTDEERRAANRAKSLRHYHAHKVITGREHKPP